MWAAIAGIFQIIYLVLQTKFERDAAERKRRDELNTGWKEAVKSGDLSTINGFVDKLRS